MSTTSSTTTPGEIPSQSKRVRRPQVRTVKKPFKRPDALPKGPDAEQAAQDKENAVQFEGGSRHHGSARTEAADNEADAHDEAAEDFGIKIGRIHPDPVIIEDTQAGGQKYQNAGHDNAGKHHLEHGHVFEIELGREFAGITEPGHFQDSPKGHADEQKDQEINQSARM